MVGDVDGLAAGVPCWRGLRSYERVRRLPDGVRRVNRAPAIVIGVWLLTLLVSLPLALVLRACWRNISAQSPPPMRRASGMNYDWMQEFGETGIRDRHDVQPTIIVFGGARQPERLPRRDASAPHHRRRRSLLRPALDLHRGRNHRSYARDRATHAFGFFAGAGEFFFRFLRLAAARGRLCVLFGAMHPWLFDTVYTRMTRD